MKKIVVLTASPRKNGNSNTLAMAFIEEARKKGHKVTRFDTAITNITTCRACDACFAKAKPCAIDDHFNCIAEAIDDADILVFASPVYWYTFPAGMKLVIDKFYSFMVGGKDFSGKECILIACCGDEDEEAFKGMAFAYEKSMSLLKCRDIGRILIAGVQDEGDIEKTDGEKRVRELAASL